MPDHINHQFHLNPQDDIPAGHAKISVIFDIPDKKANKTDRMAAFLKALPDEPEQPGLSREAIGDYLQLER